MSYSIFLNKFANTNNPQERLELIEALSIEDRCLLDKVLSGSILPDKVPENAFKSSGDSSLKKFFYTTFFQYPTVQELAEKVTKVIEKMRREPTKPMHCEMNQALKNARNEKGFVDELYKTIDKFFDETRINNLLNPKLEKEVQENGKKVKKLDELKRTTYIAQLAKEKVSIKQLRTKIDGKPDLQQLQLQIDRYENAIDELWRNTRDLQAYTGSTHLPPKQREIEMMKKELAIASSKREIKDIVKEIRELINEEIFQ